MKYVLLLLLFLTQLSAFKPFEIIDSSNKIEVLEKPVYFIGKHTSKETSEKILTKLPQIVVFSIFTGLFLSFFFYNAFLYLSTKEREYLLYTFYILSLYLFMLSFEEFIFQLLDFDLKVKNFFKIISFSATLLFLLFFTLKYFDVKKLNYKLYKITLSICAIVLVLCFSTPYLGAFGQIISVVLMIVVNILTFNIGYISYFNGYYPAKYYLFGIIGFLIGFFVSLGVINNLLDYNLYTSSAMLIGSAWEIVFFSLALGYKIKLVHMEKNEALSKVQVQEKMLFLQSRQASVGELVGNIAHQWREPLGEIGAIQTNLKATLLFKGAIGKEKLLNSVEQSYNIIRHLSDTIDVFYRFFRHKSSDKEEFDIVDEIHNLQKMVHYSLEVENITLKCECKQKISAFGERSEFANALLNIILNAKDVLVERKITNPFIKIKTYNNEDAIFITIEDNAGGIKQEPIEKIFEISISSKEESIGIGLFIAKAIIEQRMRGSLSVENGVNGAMFTIMLPLSSDVYNLENELALYDIEESAFEKICSLERKVAKNVELEKALAQWEDIFNQTHWGVAVHKGTSNRFEMVNPAFCSMHGYSEQEIKSMNLYEVFSSQSLSALEKKQKEAFVKGFVSFESEHLRKDGSKFPVNIDITVVKDENGDILYHITNVRDITEQKKAREKLYLKKFAVDNIRDAIFLADKNGNFAYVNEAACSSLGYTKDELLSMNVGDVDPNWPKERWPEFWEILKESKTALVEVVHKRRDGTLFPVEVKANYFEYDGVEYNLGLARDITERKSAQKKLMLLHQALNNTNEATYIVLGADIVQVNDGACKMLGYSREELASMTLYDIDTDLTPESLRKIRDNARKQNNRFERKHYTKDGRILDVEIDTNAFEYEGVTYAFSAVRDITKQKKAREELLLKEFALNKINEAVFLIDKDSMFHYVNEGACKALGYTKEELLTKGVVDLDPNVSIEWWREHWKDIKRLGTTLGVTEHIKSDGTIYPIEVSSNYFEYNDIEYSLAVSRDITERIRLEEQKDNERMRLFFERQLVGMAITSPEKGWLHVNDKLCEMLGYTFEELRNMTWAEVTFPEDLASDVEQFEKLLNSEIEDYMLEKRFIRKDETIVYTNLAVSCVRNDDGTVNYVLALLEDITKRKQIEKALRKNQMFLSDAQRVSHVGSWELDIANDTLSWSDETYRIFELDKDTTNELHKTFYEYVHPDDREAVSGLYEESLKTKLPYEVDHRIIMPDGRVKYVTERCETIYADDDTPLHSIGTVHDITERKLMEKELEDSYNFLNQLIDSVPDPIFVKDRGHNWILLNEAFCSLINQPREVLIGKSDYDFFPKEEADIFWDKDEVVFSLGEVNINEEFFTSADGVTHAIETVKTSFKKSDGREYLVGTIRDITQRKQAADELKEKSQELQTALEFNEGIINAIPDLLFEIAPDGTYVGVWAQDKELLIAQREMLIGKNFKDILPPHVVDISFKTMKEVDEKGYSLGNSYFLDLPEGKKWFELSVSKKASSGTYIVLSRDITKRKEAEKKVKELNITLENKVTERTWELQQSLEFTKGVINAIPDLLFEVDREGTYLEIWAQNEELLAAQKELLLGKKFSDVLSPEAAKIALEGIKEAEEKGLSFGKSIKIDLPDGEHWFELSTSTKRISDTFLVISRDITQRKAAESELKGVVKTLHKEINEREEIQKQLRFVSAAVNSSSEAIYVNDKELSILYVNEGACKMLGYTYEELTSMKIYEIDAQYQVDDIVTLAKKTTESQQAVFKTKHKAKDGRIIDVEIVGNPFTFDDTEVFVSVVKDISKSNII